jgi:hypothetical protein
MCMYVQISFFMCRDLNARSIYADISIRIIGKRAHPMHTMSYFSLWCVLVSVVAMITAHTPWVLPSRWSWLGLLIIVGIFGFVAQVIVLFLKRSHSSLIACAYTVTTHLGSSERDCIPWLNSTLHPDRVFACFRAHCIWCASIGAESSRHLRDYCRCYLCCRALHLSFLYIESVE